MFFERIGRLLPWWTVFFAFCMPLGTAAFLWHRQGVQQELNEQFISTRTKARAALARQQRAEQFFARHAHSDPYFIDKRLESLPFLKQEQTMLQPWVNHPAFPSRREVETRLSFLQSEQNLLVFNETKTNVGSECKETTEVQRRPIELDESDLKTVLGVIEETDSSTTTCRPQLLITDFHLTPKNHTFTLEMNLLKREFP